jgi:matrixin
MPLRHALAAAALLWACAQTAEPPPAGTAASTAPVGARTADPETGFLAPNTQDLSGAPAYVHFTPEDMPLRVNVELPLQGARYNSREVTDAAVVGALRSWEAAARSVLPWFRLEIVRGDREAAPIHVSPKKSLADDALARGGISWTIGDGRVRARGWLEYATGRCDELYCQVDLDALTRAVTHEFGHTLGLGHCAGCDSVMSDAWKTATAPRITDVDLATLRALYALPNGSLAGGAPMDALPASPAQ